MKSLPKLQPNIWDGLVALAVVLLAAVCVAVTWLGSTDTDLQAVISVDGAEVERIDLTKLDEPVEKVVQANGYTLHLAMDASGVTMTESDCPTQDCVHTGSVSRSGQSIVCLPARVIIQLEGTVEGDGPDVVIG